MKIYGNVKATILATLFCLLIGGYLGLKNYFFLQKAVREKARIVSVVRTISPIPWYRLTIQFTLQNGENKNFNSLCPGPLSWKENQEINILCDASGSATIDDPFELWGYCGVWLAIGLVCPFLLFVKPS